MTHRRQVAVKAVADQLINMLTNNLIEDNGTEPFEGWCEDGNVFKDNLRGEYFDEAVALMKEVSPLIDKLTYCYLNYGY